VLIADMGDRELVEISGVFYFLISLIVDFEVDMEVLGKTEEFLIGLGE
jgi:hypothetical protein